MFIAFIRIISKNYDFIHLRIKFITDLKFSIKKCQDLNLLSCFSLQWPVYTYFLMSMFVIFQNHFRITFVIYFSSNFTTNDSLNCFVICFFATFNLFCEFYNIISFDMKSVLLFFSE